MSNALSIAAVTAVLKDLLENGLVSDSITASVGDVMVTALPPDLITVGTDERAQLNLFLYQVTQNRNVDWVSQEFRSKNSRINKNPRSTNPPLALDLHYLLTAYGPTSFRPALLTHSLRRKRFSSRAFIRICNAIVTSNTCDRSEYN